MTSETELYMNDDWYKPVDGVTTKKGKVEGFTLDPINGFSALISTTSDGEDDVQFDVTIDNESDDYGEPVHILRLSSDGAMTDRFCGEILEWGDYSEGEKTITFTVYAYGEAPYAVYDVAFDLSDDMEWRIEANEEMSKQYAKMKEKEGEGE